MRKRWKMRERGERFRKVERVERERGGKGEID